MHPNNKAQAIQVNSSVLTLENCKSGKNISSMTTIPDVVLVLIFQNLDTLSLINASKVCRRWYNASHDKSLIVSVDLRTCLLGLQQLWKVSHRKLSKDTKSFHFRGKRGGNKVMEKLSLAYLQDLFNRCKDLEQLSVEQFDLREIPLEYLLQSPMLSSLSVRDSMLSMNWFSLLKEKNPLLHLKELNLHSCSKISNNDLEAISYLTSLEKLVLCNCHRISARGIPTIARNLRNLKHLDFTGCPAVNDVVLFHVSNLSLQTLSLSFCHLVTDYGIGQLFKGTGSSQTLEKLNLLSCHEITDKALDEIILHSKKLKELNISGCCKFTSAKIDQLGENLPSCNILNNSDIVNECSKNEQNYGCCKQLMDK